MLRIAFKVIAVLVLLFVGRLLFLNMNAQPRDTLASNSGRLAPCPESPNCVSSLAERESQRVEALVLPGDPMRAFDQIVAIIESMRGARLVTVDQGYIHAEFSSRVFRFVDDLELLYDHSIPGFQVRSGSRVGRSDLGANRKRVEALRTNLAAANAETDAGE